MELGAGRAEPRGGTGPVRWDPAPKAEPGGQSSAPPRRQNPAPAPSARLRPHTRAPPTPCLTVELRPLPPVPGPAPLPAAGLDHQGIPHENLRRRGLGPQVEQPGPRAGQSGTPPLCPIVLLGTCG